MQSSTDASVAGRRALSLKAGITMLYWGAEALLAVSMFSVSLALLLAEVKIAGKAMAIITPAVEAGLRNPRGAAFPAKLLRGKGQNPQQNHLFHAKTSRMRLCCERRLVEMTKADLVEKVTGVGDLTRRDSEVIVETIFDSVIAALKGGDKIEIRGFGSFRIRQRNPRIGRNPKTGARVDVPAKKVPYFKPSKELRDLVNPKAAASAA
jgi:integration host factor subunit beta